MRTPTELSTVTRRWGAILWIIAVVQYAVSVAGQYSGSKAYLGLGAGGAERLASYPTSLWMLLAAAVIAPLAVQTRRLPVTAPTRAMLDARG